MPGIYSTLQEGMPIMPQDLNLKALSAHAPASTVNAVSVRNQPRLSHDTDEDANLEQDHVCEAG